MILTFFNSYKIYEVPSRFSYQHCLLMMFSLLYIVAIAFLFRYKSKEKQTILMISLSVCMALVFFGRLFFGWEGARIGASGSKTSILPLELCNINIYVTLLACITKKKSLFSYLYFVSLFGALIPLIIFPDCHMIVNGRNLFHYMFFDYYFIHTNLVAIPIWLISWSFYKPSFKDVLPTTIVLIIVHLFVFVSSMILRNFSMFANANYMYVYSASNLPILRELYQLIHIPYVYELPLLIVVVPIFYLMALPFEMQRRRKK
jgi:hypothetical integral membrane protein (TIGR02206 family)